MDNNTQRLFVSNFIENIVKIRTNTGKSQDEVSKILGITRQTLSALENDRGDYKFTNVLSLAALFDYYAKKDQSVKAEIDASAFYIIESDYPDCIFPSSVFDPETLSEAWLQKRFLYESNELQSVLFDWNDLNEYCLYIDLISFCDCNLRDVGTRLSQFCLRLQGLEPIQPYELFLDKNFKGVTVSEEIHTFIKELHAFKDKKIIKVHPLACDHSDSYDTRIKDMKTQKPCLILSSNINKLLQCRTAVPLLITKSGLLIRVDKLNDEQILNLKKDFVQTDDDQTSPSVLDELFES